MVMAFLLQCIEIVKFYLKKFVTQYYTITQCAILLYYMSNQLDNFCVHVFAVLSYIWEYNSKIID